ncbi:hypothetical protein [Elstera sp.]|jgi:hypothetical protein|uniref:hypothetical protein n=1 Tax=Elstera sp. TaxID=1916664 RepID=UPI0037BF1700
MKKKTIEIVSIFSATLLIIVLAGYWFNFYSKNKSFYEWSFQNQSNIDNIISYNIAKDYKRVGSLYYENTVDMLFKSKIIDEVCFINQYSDLPKLGKTVSQQTHDHAMNGAGTAIVLLKENAEVYFIKNIPGGLHDPSTKCYSSPPQN